MRYPSFLSRPALRPWLLLGEGLFWLALSVGLAFGFTSAIDLPAPPAMWTSHSDTYCFRASSDSYGPVYDWLEAQPQTRGVDFAWDKPCITFTYKRPADLPALRPPWKALGFEPPLSVRSESKSQPYVADAGGRWARVLVFRCGILLFGVVGLWVARRRGVPLLPVFGGNPARAVATGVIVGCALVALELVITDPLNQLTRHLIPRLKPQGISPDQFHVGMAAALAYLSVLTPIAEETLFRALIFGRIAGAGYTVFGAIASAILFAAVHLDPWNAVVLFIGGVVLAEVYRRTHLLIAPIIVHGMINAFPLLMIRFAH